MGVDLTPVFLRVRCAFQEAGLTMTDRYIGLVAHFIHRILPSNELAAFIDPGPPPAGDNGSGDISKPEPSIIPNSGKAECGTGHSHSAGTRKEE